MDKEVATHAAETLKAVAHPVRLQIVAQLEKNREMCVNDIVSALGAKHSITSQQLPMMKDKGILTCRRQGPKVFYRILNESVIRVLHCIYDH